MDPARLLVLGISVCGILSSARAQDPRAQVWIHQMVDLHQHAYARQDLFDAGYRADQAHEYGAAFDNLSGFSEANHDRLQTATSTDEKAFRDWLKSRLKDLEGRRDQRFRQNGEASKGPSQSAASSPEYSQPTTSDGSTQQFSGSARSQGDSKRARNSSTTHGQSGSSTAQGDSLSTTSPGNGNRTEGPTGSPVAQGNSQPATTGGAAEKPSFNSSPSSHSQVNSETRS